ncbi:Type I Iterative Polyketide synthase (PKS) [Orbilia oligospora]|uniref:Type I Iterative Polyketide synthase (PKS) n=2 Tax=Orbilia oligospora TaxID=2813651 RepID=A0A8H2HPN5_ORBOL|nr:Type I Iterative Polyketide synthase (PKS) [Orbilia oligospora]
MATGISAKETTASEPLAIIGFAFKFPSGVTDSETLWKVMINGEDCLVDVPEDRFNMDAFRDTGSGSSGSVSSKPKGYFINDNIAAFDAPFFSITAEEAGAMDPQQRVLLETTYHAIENAGLTMNELSGSRTSVHVGCLSQDYGLINSKDPEAAPKYTITGTELSMIPNRLSWFFNLKGPSLAVDTACSSSLVALDLACQLLRSGETDIGIVAGTNLMHMPDFFVYLDNMGFLSPNSRCHSFDSRANGYARAEGSAVLLIKRVSDAIRDGNTIRAVIRASGSNSDGYTSGITQPNGDSQLALIRETYQKAGLSMQPTRYCEAHGTGTALGDPIESHAIGAAFRTARSPDDMLYMGAAKASMGHMEAASGMSGIIRAVLVLENGIIPPIADLVRLNPAIDDIYYRLKFPTEAAPWPSEGLRRASLNSFGFGGTNAHAVIDDAYNFLAERGLKANHNTIKSPLLVIRNHTVPTGRMDSHEMVNTKIPQQMKINEHQVNGSSHTQGPLGAKQPQSPPSHTDLRPYLLLISAADRDGVKRIGESYHKYFTDPAHDPSSTPDVCRRLAYTLEKCRSSLPWRAYAVIDSPQSLKSIEPSVPRRPLKDPRAAFVFTGQGAQYPKMGIELMRYPAFAQSIKRSAKCLISFGCDWDLVEELTKEGPSSRVNDPAISQPLSSAIQIALVDLLDRCNLKPAVVIGHSSGEVAAAYCKGAISQKSAMKIAYFRGMGGAAASTNPDMNGTMMAVGLGEAEMSYILQDLSTAKGYHDIHIGCINSPKSVTVAGDAEQIDSLKTVLDEKGIFARRLKISCAYHSPHMIPIAKEYLPLVESLDVRDGYENHDSIPMISYLTGENVSGERLRELDYWMANMYSAVNFTKSTAQIDQLASISKKRKRLDLCHRNGILITNILEVGPHSALRGPLREIMKEFQFAQDIQYESTLVRGKSASDSFLRAIGGLQCSGFHPDISYLNSSLDPGSGGDFQNTDIQYSTARLIDLPAYPFSHSHTYWKENQRSKNERFRRKPNELLGTPTPDWHPLCAIWRNFLTRSKSEWIEDYNIGNAVAYPAAGMLATAIEAMNQYARGTLSVEPLAFCFKDVEFLATMHVPEPPAELETQIHLRAFGENQLRKDLEGSPILPRPNAWFEFSIFSCEADQWKMNCKGLIRAEFDSNSYEGSSTKNKHSSAKNFPTDQFYSIIGKAGYTLGPSFQRIGQLQWTVPEEVRAMVNVYQYESDPSSQLKRVSRAVDRMHIIHPVTLDAILQVTLASIIRETPKSVPAFMPTKLERLWLSTAGFNCPNSHISVAARLNFYGYHGTKHSVSVTDSQNDVKLEITGYEMARVSSEENNSALMISPAELHTCWKFNWTVLTPITSGIKSGIGHATQDRQLLCNGVDLGSVEVHVYDPSPAVTELATALQSVFESNKQICQIIDSMRVADFDSSANLKIILWDVDKQSILANLNKDNLSFVQKTLKGSNRILWIQTERAFSSLFPSNHLINGLSRVVSQEQNMASFATLSTISTDTPGQVEAISRVYWALISERDGLNMPQKFRETAEGDIEFCQLSEDRVLTQKVQSAQVGSIPTTISWDINTPLKITIGSPVPRLPSADKGRRGEATPPSATSEHKTSLLSVLDTIHFIEDTDSAQDALPDNQVEIEVKAVGMSFNDYLVASGVLKEENLGSEVAGVVTRIGRDADGHGLVPGSRVCGLSTDGYRTLFRNQAQHFSIIPEALTFAEAASIPLNFVTAWHSLRHVARLKAGESVLIHSGAGGTGQAAIQIAKYLGAARIFTTVGIDEKREILTTRYGIPSDHIFSSRGVDSKFVKDVMRLTEGYGVDVVLGSLSGEIISNSWECIAPFGRFVEVGKQNIQNGLAGAISMTRFEKNCSYNVVDINYMFLKRPEQVTELVNEVLRLFEQASLQIVNQIHRFDISNVKDAFELMESGKSSGKIIVEMGPASQVEASLTQKQSSSLTANASYVISGCFGDHDLGSEIARWMAERGAKYLILLPESGSHPDSVPLRADLEAMGVHCIIPSCDISNHESLKETLESLARTAPRIRGCIHANDSMIPSDALFSNTTHAEWNNEITCKVSGSWNLHSLLPEELDFFVLLSSVAGIIGSRSQGASAAADTYMDALAQHRISHGLKAVSLHIGPFDIDGYLGLNSNPNSRTGGPGDHLHAKRTMLAQNTDTYIPVQRSELHALLDHYCDDNLPLLQPDEVQTILGLRLLHTDPQLDSFGTEWGKNPMFQELRRLTEMTASRGKGSGGQDDTSRFSVARSDKEAAEIVLAALTRRLASTIAGMDPEDIDQNKAVHTYGVDSLQTTELRNWFLKYFRSDVPVFEILGAPSLSSLAHTVVRRSDRRVKK